MDGTAYEQSLIRKALLAAESEWLEQRERAETLTQRTIALVIADAFHQEADKYKTVTKETNDDRFLWDDDELAEARALPE